MKCAIILLFVLVSLSGISASRDKIVRINELNVQDSVMIWDKLPIQIDPKINELLKQQVTQSKKNGTIGGYRLQIYFGSGEKAHAQALKIKTDFLSLHPDVKVYLQFKSPDFNVRIGDFRTKSEALKMQKTLVYQYPNSFIVADDIAFPQLVNNSKIN
jgi:hypothetical protein